MQSPKHGFLPTACVFSLPKVLSLYGIALLVLQVYLAMLRMVFGPTGLAIGAFSISAYFVISRMMRSNPHNAAAVEKAAEVSEELEYVTVDKDLCTLV